jgi:hypothetical protein
VYEGSNLVGGSGRDVLCGTTDDDRLDGQGGNDELQGSFDAANLA